MTRESSPRMHRPFAVLVGGVGKASASKPPLPGARSTTTTTIADACRPSKSLSVSRKSLVVKVVAQYSNLWCDVGPRPTGLRQIGIWWVRRLQENGALRPS